MYKSILVYSLLCFSNFIFAQENEVAIKLYKDAELAFAGGQYGMAISNLDVAETMLKGTNPKIQSLKLKSYKQAAILDSINSFKAYATYVAELQTKKSDLAANAILELSNYSRDKALLLEDKLKSLITPLEGITIGQPFSSLEKEKYSLIDFNKPIDEATVLRYVRKKNESELQIGLFEIVVDKSSSRIVKIVRVYAVYPAIPPPEEMQESANSFKIIFQCDPKTISTVTQLEKVNKKEYNVVFTKANIDASTTIFQKMYVPTKYDPQDISSKINLRFKCEGYEIK